MKWTIEESSNITRCIFKTSRFFKKTPWCFDRNALTFWRSKKLGKFCFHLHLFQTWICLFRLLYIVEEKVPSLRQEVQTHWLRAGYNELPLWISARMWLGYLWMYSDSSLRSGWQEKGSRTERNENEGQRRTSARKFIDINLIIKKYEVPEEEFPFFLKYL